VENSRPPPATSAHQAGTTAGLSRRGDSEGARLVLSAFPTGGAYAKSFISVEPQFFLTDSIPFFAAASEDYISLLPMTC